MSKEGFLVAKPTVSPTASPISSNTFDYSESNLILMIGGQILIIILVLIILFSKNKPITFPSDAVRQIFRERKSPFI